jgi:hypothetical protein
MFFTASMTFAVGCVFSSAALIMSTGEAELATERSVRRVPKTTTTSPASARAAWALGVVTVWAKTGPPKHVTRATMLVVATKCLHVLSVRLVIIL